MKEQRLMQVFGEINDTFVEEADPTRRRHPLPVWRLVAAAAAVTLAVGLSLSLFGGEQTPPPIATDPDATDSDTYVDDAPGTESGSTSTTGTTVATETSTTTKKAALEITSNTPNAEIAIVPRWENMTITQQFTEVKWLESTYTVRGATLKKEQVGEKLGSVTATGYDIYGDTTHHINVTLYRLADIAEECAVAVQYEGHDDYYPANNPWYRPDTLGQFLTDLQLEKYLIVGNVYENGFEDGYYREATYTGLTKEAVWQYLLADTALKNVYDQQAMYVGTMNISIEIPILGYEFIALWVTEDGYLATNILDTGKAFYLGKDKVQAFIQYVHTHCKGTVHTRTTGTTNKTDAPEDSTATTATKPAKTVTGQTSKAYIPE